MSLANLKVGARLGLGFGVVLLLLTAIAVVGVSRLGTMDQGMGLMINDRYPKTVVASDMVNNLNRIARSMRNMLIMEKPEDIKKELERIVDAKAKIVKDLDKLEKSITSEKGKEMLKGVTEPRAKYVVMQDRFLQLVADDKAKEARVILLGELRPAQLAYFDGLEKLIEFQGHLMEEAGKQAGDDYLAARNLMVGLAIVAGLLGAAIAFWVTRSITRPLQQAVAVATAVAQGDLTQRIDVKSKDETGQLLQALKEMNESLSGIVGDVRGSTDSITTAAKQIAAGNSDLSQRTEEQASSLEETASSMEELTSTVKQNAENAKQANQLAASASDVAVKGGQVVGQVVQTMASISDSSKKIVDIISVIEGIAFQTNILALNAAVEAARAGEQGRGFAVVAGEVRNLAQRSAAAAKEIKTLIGDSVDKVDTGAKLVDQAGTTMNEIVGAVKRVTDIMSEISAASTEQSAGIEQVNQAITQMDEVTQQNAALVEEAAAAAESMEEQARGLLEAVGIFKLEAAGGRKRMASSSAVQAAPVHTVASAGATKATKLVKTTKAKPAQLSKPVDNPDGEWAEF